MTGKKQSKTNSKWRDMAEKDALAEKKATEAPDEIAQEPSFEGEVADNPEVDLFTDDLSSPPDKSTAKIALLEKQVAEHKAQVARAQAELENVRRRLERDVSKAHKFGAERLVAELLPVIDSLVRALEGLTEDDPNMGSMREGLEMTLDMFHKALEKHGILVIEPAVGDLFDPAQHEAMTMQADPSAKSNTILQVLQKGYALNGRVLRAAMVVVAS